jgi:predicted nucleic acid-binding protein
MGVKKIIKKHKKIMFDTAPVIYFIEEHKDFGKITDDIFKVIKNDSTYYSFSSVITLTEVLTKPLREGRKDIVEKYRNFLLNSSNFTIYPVDSLIAEKAAELRAQYGLKTPDAIQIAIGIENNGTIFISNDKNLKIVKEIEVMILEEYL